METEQEEVEQMETKQTEIKEPTITIKKGHLLAIVGVVIVASIFIFAAQAMIANAGKTPQSVNYKGAPAASTALVQSEKQVIQLSMKDGNYYPNTIRLKKGIPAEIVVDMNTVKGCYRGIQIPAFGVRKTVSTSDNKIDFTPDKAGTFGFSCYMGMGTGQLIVEDETGSVPANVNTVSTDIPKGGSCGSSGGGCGCGG